MSFAGIDPAGLHALGTRLRTGADTVDHSARRALPLLERNGRWAAADRTGTGLSATARSLRALAEDFGWRIDAVRRSDRSIAHGHSPWDLPISRVELAVGLPPGMASTAIGLTRNEVRQLAEKSPADVAGFFAELNRAEVGVLVATHPRMVSGLDGAPPWARYMASDLLIAARAESLAAEAAALRAHVGGLDLGSVGEHLVNEYVAGLEATAAELERWLREDRQILHFDPAGDGRVVEVFGDLENSTNIGIVVPGITNDLSNFSVGDGGFRANARNLHTRSEQLEVDSVATVAWLGYDTPDGPGALIKRAAEAGHTDLIDFVTGMDTLAGRRHVAVIGHSYGSLVTGLAAKAGLAANEVVFVGSPGTGLAHASEARLKPGGVVWAGLAHGDPVGAGVDLSEYLTPDQQLRRTLEHLLDTLGGEKAVKELHHGVNPAHEDFGAIEFHTDGATGHSEYFEPETVSLDNLLFIIAGMDSKVMVEIPDEIELAPGPFGEPAEPVGEVA